MLELIIILVYLCGMITIGVWSKRNANKVDDFFVAGRKGSTPLITTSLLATIIGASATVGMAGLGFTRGLTGAWWILVGTVGLIVLGLLFAKKVRSYGLYTLPQLVDKMYGRNVSLATSILIVIAWVGIVAGQIMATGQIMSSLGIGSTTLWMVICTAVFILYTVLGGQYSVIRTDFAQIIIIFIGIFVGLGFLFHRIGGFEALITNLPADRFAFPVSSQFNTIQLISMLLLVGSTYAIGPDMFSRLFCAKDGSTARRSALWAAVLLIPIAFGIVLIGMGAAVLAPQISPEQSFPTVIGEVFPTWLSGIVLAALLSAVMSSAVTCLLSASTIANVDIIYRLKPSLNRNRLLSSSRWGVIILGLAALALALALKGIINTLMFAYTVYTAGVILPIAAGFYKERLKVTPNAALAAIIGGGTTAVISKIFTVKYLDLGALGVSILLLVIVSVIENRLKNRKTITNVKS
ncbi:MAG: sodium:solute symporter family protein [Dehalococcoidales bacterium]|nr:sodium:solute symporter family protein [Dehalococcoidales bacterium]